MRPITLKKNEAIVPCGRCPQCIARRVSAWSFRLLEESKVATSAYFLTLTYDTKYVPINQSGLMDLCKRDLQLFFKRLRKSQCGNSVSPIKYYAVGEYGGRTKRPHYHCILFNADIELINASWNLGMIHYGKVSGASVGYTLKYMSKNRKKVLTDDRQPEFSLMSKGLGISYLNEEMAAWHCADLINRVYCTLIGGQKISMPRYYKDKLYLELERTAIRDAHAIINHERQLVKLDKSTTISVRNEKQAIDAAYNKMYLKSLKTKI